ncbi:alpha-mannosidase [Sphingobacterium shayense]|uniref:glycoside hydrolase family 38 N-terminal domain-containing protein n=1 Tax=Sphingobacterium shayense TaxID=626343 RepID=UPI001552D4C3|nr:glycoside hydrolase family 38 C-terminal domain-containing protein [Sphingobacterium shayense]NQD71993.1 alpha-mannosidase [Sphingobacterium shayense]
MVINTRIFTVLFLSSVCFSLSAQKAYFVDGYHGGVYGHYPSWVTGFMVDNLAAHPEWRIGLEIEPETWDSVQRREPEAYARFAAIANDSRVEFTNPTYAQPYCYNISGESIIRQFEYGMQKIEEHFPAVSFTTYAVEEPCFTSSLPQLLKQFGFKYAVLKCPNTLWGGYTSGYGGELVNWVGPEGSSILSVPRYASEEFEENSTWQTTAWNNSASFLKAAYSQGIQNPVGMCYQDAGWDNGPWLGTGRNIKNGSTYVTWTEYIEEVSSRQTDDNWHFTQEDIRVNLMWGSQALQRIAQDVRKAENKIVMAEKISAMAHIDNDFRVHTGDEKEAWRTLMMAQHHDSWIVPYNHLSKEQTWEQAVRLWTIVTDSLSETMIRDAVSSYITSKSASGDNLGYVRIFNTVAATRSEIVRIALPQALEHKKISLYDHKGEEIPSIIKFTQKAAQLVFKPKVGSLGYVTYALREGGGSTEDARQQVSFQENGKCIIENQMYKLTLDGSRGGVITSLVAKHAGNKEFVDQHGDYGFGELSGHFYDQQKFHSTKDVPAKITVLEDNPFMIRVKVESSISSHPVTQIITLESGQRRIDFDLLVDWRENVGIGEYKQEHKWTDNRRAYTDDRYKLKVLFPNSLRSADLYKNAPFDVTESTNNDTFFGEWEEIKHNVILHWVDLVQKDQEYGLTLLSDHTTSYLHGADYPLGLTAQYSGVGLWGVDYRITEPLKMRYALIPHLGSWDSAQIATESNFWNEPLLGVYANQLSFEARSFVSSLEDGLEVSAMKIDNQELLLRIFNAEGPSGLQQIALGFPAGEIQEVLLNGEKVSTIELTNSTGKSIFSTNIPRFGIKTFRIKKKDI